MFLVDHQLLVPNPHFDGLTVGPVLVDSSCQPLPVAGIEVEVLGSELETVGKHLTDPAGLAQGNDVALSRDLRFELLDLLDLLLIHHSGLTHQHTVIRPAITGIAGATVACSLLRLE